MSASTTLCHPHKPVGAQCRAASARHGALPASAHPLLQPLGTRHANVPQILWKSSRRCPRVRQRWPAVKAVRNVDWPEALLFDCDGVLVDTEPDGHRVAFNQAFAQKGLKHEWSLEKYGELLRIGGGKERMTAYFMEHEGEEPFASMPDPAQRAAFVKELHLLKTDIFMRMVESGMMPLRPGVQRLVGEAMEAGTPIAVCSTSNERAVSTIVRMLLGSKVAEVMRVFAGDVVPRKKPAPDVYNLAAKELGVNPRMCVVIEDSHIGQRAAHDAGMRCIVTKSRYTEGEDFDVADAVFDCIGDAGAERFSLHDLTTPGSFWVNMPAPVQQGSA